MGIAANIGRSNPRNSRAMSNVEKLNSRIIECFRCPRLVAWREQVAKEGRKAFRGEKYWAKPVPNFGDSEAERLIVGLAPAAHGGNRTGRPFTGDRSGKFLFEALHRAGVANQPTCERADDGLKLKGVMITAVIHCAPPANKPLPSEIENCKEHFVQLLSICRWKAFLCLGSIAWTHLFRTLGEKPPVPFAHKAVTKTSSGAKVVASYHPSQQNTFTGKLTERMFDEAIRVFLRD
jgi:uracil-DNA glycosylase family 4